MAVQARQAVPPKNGSQAVWRPTGSLSRRITRLVVLTALVAASVGVLPSLWQAYGAARAGLYLRAEDAITKNRNVAIAALEVGDQSGSRIVAKRIATAAGATSVRLFDYNGDVAADFTRPREERAQPSPRLPRWQRVLLQYAPELPAPTVRISRGLDINGDPIGSLEMALSTRPVLDAVLEQLNPALAAILAAVVAALFIAARLRRQISKPIGHLLQTMDEVAHSQNYAVRATPHGPDEVGSLIVSFNQMLHQVDSRNQRLAEHRRKLQELVIERTRNFEQAAREAEKASRAKGDFLARMSHEIRTPMNGVVGMAELLENTRLEERQHRMLHTMRSSADSLLEIINDILDFSRIEAGQLQVLQTDFSLIDVIEEVCELLAPRAHERNLELVCDIDAKVPALCAGDPIRLRQIITNLLGNAVKYTEKGEIVLRATATPGGNGHFQLRIEVEDTGLGIPENQIGVIFDAFTQGDSFETRKHGGTGLGLAITKQLVTLLGGEVDLSSKVGVGTKVWLTVPLAAAAGAGHAQPRWSTSVRSVLLVQDNEAAAKAVGSMFEVAGARVWPARTGHRAMECLAIDNFDLVLVDELLPDMPGRQLIDRLRGNQATAGLPVVLMTSTKPAAAELAAGDYSSEPDATFAKPLRRARLHEAVDRALGRGNAATSRAAAAGKPKLGLRVLLVEDSPVNLQVAVGMLEAIGCKVDTASDGALGVEQALSWSFDVILMDCQMPLVDGFEATRRIRAAEAAGGRKPMPIIALTANALQGDRERCLAAGMSDFISKPFTMAKLQSSLRAAVPAGAAAPAAAKAEPEDREPTVNEALRPAADGELPVVDAAQIAELRSLGRPQVLVQATGLFKKQAVQKLDELEEALQRGDATGVEHAAHALKSSALSIGGRRFAAAAGECELAARRSDLAAAGHYPGSLRSEFTSLCEALAAATKAEERAA